MIAPALAFKDMNLRHNECKGPGAKLELVNKKQGPARYQFINIHLQYKAPETEVAQMRHGLDNAYAGNPSGRKKIMLMECLGLLGKQSAPKIAFILTFGMF